MPNANPAASNPDDADVRAMEMIKSSGILNPNVTLERVMDLTQRLAEASAGEVVALHTDTFIHKHFIWKHTD
jgi:hypothetical protein